MHEGNCIIFVVLSKGIEMVIAVLSATPSNSNALKSRYNFFVYEVESSLAFSFVFSLHRRSILNDAALLYRLFLVPRYTRGLVCK